MRLNLNMEKLTLNKLYIFKINDFLTVVSLDNSVVLVCEDFPFFCCTWSPSGSKIKASREITECPLECELGKWPFPICLLSVSWLPLEFSLEVDRDVVSADDGNDSPSPFVRTELLLLANCCWSEGSASELPLRSKLTRVRFFAVSIFCRPYWKSVWMRSKYVFCASLKVFLVFICCSALILFVINDWKLKLNGRKKQFNLNQ